MLGFYNGNLTVNRKRQIVIILGGIVLAILLILSTIRTESWQSDISPASQKKPKQNTPALFDSLL